MPSLTYNYVDAINQNLLCCICRMPFIDPFTTRSCGHTFCRDCILESLDHALQCPIDRSPLTTDDLQPANPIIRSLVDELAVECTNHPCSHTCQRQLLEQHLQSSCLYIPVPCPDGGCDQIMLRREAVTHRCEHSIVKCDACSSQVRAFELEDHRTQCLKQLTTCESCKLQFPRSSKSSHQNSCPETVVHCPQQENGCSWRGKRAALYSEHTSTCPYQAISGFFAIYHEKTKVLEDENVLLRRRVESLENHVRTMEIELQSARIALGPWIRNTASSFSLDTPTPNPGTPQRPQLRIVASGIPSLPSSSQSVLEGDPLAPYFPAQDNTQSFDRQQSFSAVERPSADRQVDRRTRSLNRNSWSLGQSWDAMHTPTNLQPTGPRAPKQGITTAVAPLNLNSTLQCSLEGLRESVVSLSKSVETLGRRSDITLTNETLRLNEEMMSLKANMHGMRMQASTFTFTLYTSTDFLVQMHAIMMENAQLTARADPLLFEHNFGPMSPHRYHYMPNSPSTTKL
ncbi:hypothetical protein D9758_001948 [Tetrapyrgos nigripes]|uniref:Uncharacterized protein n=1 Tax=Tetrapyrgos nigripes TaxID=182062 RepID=A0A8H5GTV1_9AGAR|nr:hypothetical protein D9758_001948 [Tetrapyrgos nigripes]